MAAPLSRTCCRAAERLRKVSNFSPFLCRLSTSQRAKPNESLESSGNPSLSNKGKIRIIPSEALFRTKDANPIDHGNNHVGFFYTLSENDVIRLNPFSRGFAKIFSEQCKAFTETSIMVRKPAIETIDFLKATDFNSPAVRYVLYGKEGTGKTLSLFNVLHYAATNGWLILHAPEVSKWIKFPMETAPSGYKPGRVDMPIESVEWLKQFKIQNQSLLEKINLKTTKKYAWNQRESADIGVPILEVIEFGVNRIKYASDCFGAVLREVKAQSKALGLKTLVIVDGANALFGRSRLKAEDRSEVPLDNVTIVHNLKKVLRNDWRGGAIVASVGPRDHCTGWFEGTSTPRSLLGKEGFECFDPFIPIEVEPYSDKEINSCLDYYIHRNWIQNENGCTTDGRKELIFLSGKNPKELMHICMAL